MMIRLKVSLFVIALYFLTFGVSTAIVDAPDELNSLTTLFDSNNGSTNSPGAGVFFDIENVGRVPITIQSWDINLDCTADSPTGDISVYRRAGTSQGFETTMDGWTLVGTEQGVVGQDVNNPTPLLVGGINIEPGETTGIAMVNEAGFCRWLYTNGTGDNRIYNNGEIEIRTGSASNIALQPNDEVFSPRVWNGTVFYILGDPLPIPTLSQWGLVAMAGIIGLAGFIAIRKKYASS